MYSFYQTPRVSWAGTWPRPAHSQTPCLTQQLLRSWGPWNSWDLNGDRVPKLGWDWKHSQNKTSREPNKSSCSWSPWWFQESWLLTLHTFTFAQPSYLVHTFTFPHSTKEAQIGTQQAYHVRKTETERKKILKFTKGPVSVLFGKWLFFSCHTTTRPAKTVSPFVSSPLSA